jgi:predicted MFS family arabinose efflux permease
LCRPSDLGLRPFGDEGTQPLPAPPPNNAPITAAAFGALRDAAKTRVFWILFATFFICGASTNGLIQVHLIPMCLDFGIPQVQAAATVPPTVRLTALRFGPERANLVFGWIFAGHQLGAATAAFGAGLSRIVWTSYLPAFFAAGALCIVAAVITLMISRAPKPVAA